jgi:hypothetical protein
MAAALAAGFQLSAMLQAYSAPPMNITSGLTTVQGSTGRPIVDNRFLARNAGEADPLVMLNLRVARAFHVGPRVQLDAMVEAFNVANRVNVLTRNANFGSRTYPTDPAPTFRQITSVGEARAVQLGLRVRF